MIIDISSINNNGKEAVWVKVDECLITADDYEALVLIEGKVSNNSGIFTFDGFIEGDIRTNCCKCLKDVSFHYKSELTQHFKRRDDSVSGSEQGIPEDEILLINGYLADFTCVVKGIIKGDMPIAVKCSDSCKGLCVRCGCDLNVSVCDCKKDYCNPVFEKLKDIQF